MADLMTIVKATNPIIDFWIEEAKQKETEKEKEKWLTELNASLRIFYQFVCDQCSFEMFRELCFLDKEYNFIGGGILNKEGDTEINIK